MLILLPQSWTGVTDTRPGQSVHEEAEIRVELSSPLYGDTPFTLQPGNCGEQGEFIQVSVTKILLAGPTQTVTVTYL